MPTKLVDSIDKEEAAIASIHNVPDKGDMALVAAAKNGNREACEVLVARHERRILAVARRITCTREDAEDVMQQSFQKAFLHLHQFEGRSSFSTWLTRVAINEARMLQRKSRGIREVSIDDSDSNEEAAIAVEIPDSGPDPEVSYSQQEREGILFSAMNQLTPGMRKTIELRELGGLSTRETAQAMGIPVPTVKARVFRGRQKLRETVKRYLDSAWITGSKTSRTGGDTKRVPQEQLACNACG